MAYALSYAIRRGSVNAHDNKTRTASLFRNGRNEAVAHLWLIQLEGDEVTISREADGSLTISPGRKRMSPRELIDWLRLQPLTDDEFPEIEGFPRPGGPGLSKVRYLLDTNVVSNICKFPNGAAASRVRNLEMGDLGTSIIVAAELRFGYMESGFAQAGAADKQTLASFEIAPWETPADFAYARIRTFLERTGRVIGQNDMLIAAHTVALGVTLVTTTNANSYVFPD